MAEKIPAHVERVKAVRATKGASSVGTVTVDQVYGGARGITSLICETSLLDANEGIRYRGLSIPECQEQLPSIIPSGEPSPESLLWLLLTGDVPTAAESESLRSDLQSRASLPAHVITVIDSFHESMHPMAQLSAAVLACQSESHFAAAYAAGEKKAKYWESTMEDSLDLIARLPLIAARIYRNQFKGRAHIPAPADGDLGGNFATMLGYDSAEFAELMRLYLVIHADHEGGNVSAHATHLVGSALSDPYYAFAGGMTGLAGPLHGLANQEVLMWLKSVQAEIGTSPTDAQVKDHLWATLKSGRVIPGYGHAVLRKTDPRFMAQREFALKHLPESPLFKLVSQVYEIAPSVLQEHGKAANPWPNVDAHSGALLVHYGLVEESYYTVLFGVARALGVLPSLVWDRAMGLPIERPKSVTTEWIEKNIK
jgi:citrate synthase